MEHIQRTDLLDFIALLESFGITDRHFISPLFSQLIAASGFSGDGIEFAAAVIKGVQPKDQLMAMQAAQMAMMHWCTMEYMRKVADWRRNSGEKEDQQLAVNMATKLARTFSAQLDTIKRYRSGGEQRVTVQHQHVSVSDGGKAIVAQSFICMRCEPDSSRTR